MSIQTTDLPALFLSYHLLVSSGLSDHTTIHCSCWYSAGLDRYIKIPEAELLAKGQKVRNSQAYRRHRVDPHEAALVVPERSSPASGLLQPQVRHGLRVHNSKTEAAWIAAPVTSSLTLPKQA